MPRARPLPLAPRPLPGEAMLSWVARLAARYDMTPAALLAELAEHTALGIGRIDRLDWHDDAELDQALSASADIDVWCIEALRVPLRHALEAAKWSRGSTAWCPDCLRDDIRCRGEAYGRLTWRLGFCVTCPRHCRRLTRVCSQCGSGACRFQARRGRLRLACDACDALVDQQLDRVLHRLPAAGPLGVLPSTELDRVVAELQAEMLASVAPPRQRTKAARVTDAAVDNHLAVTVRHLGRILLDAARVGACRPLRLRDRSGGFAAVGVEVAHDLLGLVAAVLSDAIGEPATAVERLRLGFPNIGVAPAGLATLIPGLGWRELQELRAGPPEWAPAVAHAVQLAAETEVKQRRRVGEMAQAARVTARVRGRPRGGRSNVKRRAW